MRWVGLLFWLVLCFSVAGVGGRWTAAEIPGWYRTLVRPSFAPANWVFGPVWTILYTLMAVAAWQVWCQAPSTTRTLALSLFLAQLAFNLAWTWIFFRNHAIGAALAEVIVLWATIGFTTFAFARLSYLAAWMMTPYLAWVTFASLLNAGFWRLN